MRILLDTNALIALRDLDHPKHVGVEAWIRSHRKNDEFHVAPQSLYEFWVVTTRPISVNGRGLSTEDASLDTVWFRALFEVLPDPPGLLDAWLDLCRIQGVSGKNAHDARLAAYAELHGIRSLATLNPRDFTRFGLDLIVPA